MPLLEHGVVLLIAVVVVWGVTDYVFKTLEHVEASIVEATVMNIRSGMRVEKARRIVDRAPPLMAGDNPVRFVKPAPAGYLPEASLPARIEPGTWFYLARTQTLYYSPKHHTYLQAAKTTDDAGASVINSTVLGWKIAGQPNGAKEALLVSVTPYKWF